jgi:Bax protein
MSVRWRLSALAAVLAATALVAWLIQRRDAEIAAPADWAVELTAGSLSVADVESAFTAAGYDFIRVRGSGGPVPRILVGRVPEDLGQVAEVRRRKALFLGSILPLVLAVNERIGAERAVIERIAERRARGHAVTAADLSALERMARTYEVVADTESIGDAAIPEIIDRLLPRVAPLPVSLALAQAAEESAWGLSRFADEGNALFGQWVWNDAAGIAPLDRAAGVTHSVKAFPDLFACALSYANNLNTHAAYAEFRQMRANMMATTGVLDGHALASTLTRYSGRGQAYVESLRSIIRTNELSSLDTARFDDGRRAMRVVAVANVNRRT